MTTINVRYFTALGPNYHLEICYLYGKNNYFHRMVVIYDMMDKDVSSSQWTPLLQKFCFPDMLLSWRLGGQSSAEMQGCSKLSQQWVPHLNNEGLASPARSNANHGHVGCLIDEVFKAVEDTAASGWGATVDASLVDGLASDAGVGIDVVMTLQEGGGNCRQCKG